MTRNNLAQRRPFLPPRTANRSRCLLSLSVGCAAGLALVLMGASPLMELAHAADENSAGAAKAVRSIDPPHITSDKSIQYDWDIVYVRVPRHGTKNTAWAEVIRPTYMEPGGDLMLLHPDGSEELLVPAGPNGSIADPYVSFDGQWVLYAHFRDLDRSSNPYAVGGASADIYKINVKSRKIVRLTHQETTPNTGVRNGPFAVYNLGPCPLPGGRVAFTSTRNGFKPTRGAPAATLQLFVMDDDGSNVEQIGYINIAGALHPVVLVDGRIMFSSHETQGIHNGSSWGIWSIHPDGTNWGPIISALERGVGAISSWHFQAQLSDGSLVVERYYNQNQAGFGTYVKLPAQAPPGEPGFGPAYLLDSRNPPVHLGRRDWNFRLPFSPHGIEALTRFADQFDGAAQAADPTRENDRSAVRMGKVTHPGAAPDNHLLTVWSPGPIRPLNVAPDAPHRIVDSGIYLIKDGKPIDEPGQMRLIKNDPKYNEQWPRALVPYKRTYGIDEPRRLPVVANDGKGSKYLPEGTPFGLVGTSSLYKRETAPNGVLKGNSVTAVVPKKAGVPYRLGEDWNWQGQGSDAGEYGNSDIVAIRILAQEPTSGGRNQRFHSHANEKLRILGEIPVRKFINGLQPLDPDGNPDTSFLARIPADSAWTFQMLDKDGMVLTSAQTWHQLRPGEIRHDCGGCHAHSQKPTEFKNTLAAQADYQPFDLTTGQTPLLTARANDRSGTQWDSEREVGLRYQSGMKNVEYYRDVKPILERSCVACHTGKVEKPAANLVLDDDKLIKPDNVTVPGTYFRLALDSGTGYRPVLFGPRPPTTTGTYFTSRTASRYVAKMRARESRLIWKIFGRRMDGLTDDDFPGNDVPRTSEQYAHRKAFWAYSGSIMPPPEAVAGTAIGPDGKPVKVAPLSDEDRFTLVRWIDLGCPIDLDFDAAKQQAAGQGWMLDEDRPTIAVTYPRPGTNDRLTRILIGMFDRYTGLDMDSFTVVADFPVDGVPAGQNLASKFQALPDWRWELRLAQPIATLPRGKLTVSIKDKQGNLSRVERTLSVGTDRAQR